MAGGINQSVNHMDTLAAHFRQINQRLASLERASSSGGGGGGGGSGDVMWVGPSAPADPTIELWYDTDEVAASVPTVADADARYVNVAGDTMAGTLSLVTGVDAAGADAVMRKAYIDSRDGLRVAKVGDTMTGPLIVNANDLSLIVKRATAGNWAYLGFQTEAGTRGGWMGLNPSNIFYVGSDIGDFVVLATGACTLNSPSRANIIVGSERFFVDTVRACFPSPLHLLVGMTASNPGLSAGHEFHAGGTYHQTCHGGYSIYSSHINAGDVSGAHYLSFARYTTIIGSVSQGANAASVLYNTTCHGPFKDEVANLDDDEALARVERWRPVSFRWKYGEDGLPNENGVAGGEVDHGFIAAELAEVQPSAVTLGHGTQADHDEWLVRKKAHADSGVEEPFDEMDPFVPGSADLGKLVPDLAAAVQALIRRVRKQDDEIAELRALIGAT